MTYRFHVETFHAEIEGAQDAYWATAIDATFKGRPLGSYNADAREDDPRGLQSMYAGDHIRVTVGNTEAGTWVYTWEGVINRSEPDVEYIAGCLENGRPHPRAVDLEAPLATPSLAYDSDPHP